MTHTVRTLGRACATLQRNARCAYVPSFFAKARVLPLDQSADFRTSDVCQGGKIVAALDANLFKKITPSNTGVQVAWASEVCGASLATPPRWIQHPANLRSSTHDAMAWYPSNLSSGFQSTPRSQSCVPVGGNLAGQFYPQPYHDPGFTGTSARSIAARMAARVPARSKHANWFSRNRRVTIFMACDSLSSPSSTSACSPFVSHRRI